MSFQLTNATSPKSDRSDTTIDSDQETVFYNGSDSQHEKANDSNEKYTDMTAVASSTPEQLSSPTEEEISQTEEESSPLPAKKPVEEPKRTQETSPSKIPRSPNNEQKIGTKLKIWSVQIKKKFSVQKHEISDGTFYLFVFFFCFSANGRTVKSVPSKKKGIPNVFMNIILLVSCH